MARAGLVLLLVLSLLGCHRRAVDAAGSGYKLVAHGRGPGSFGTDLSLTQDYWQEWHCEPGVNQYCTLHWIGDINHDFPGYDICASKLNIINFDPPNPGTDSTKNEYAATSVSLRGNVGQRQSNRVFVDAQTHGELTPLPWGAGGNMRVRVTFTIVKQDVDDEIRKGIECVMPEGAVPVPPKPPGPPRTTACACVMGDEKPIEACLKGQGDCNRLTNMKFSQCVPARSDCAKAFSGGNCATDLNPSLKQVIVENSPYCSH